MSQVDCAQGVAKALDTQIPQVGQCSNGPSNGQGRRRKDAAGGAQWLRVLVRSVRSDHLQECRRSNDCCHRAYEYHIDEDEGCIAHGTLPATRCFPIERLSLRGEVRCSKLLTFAILFGAEGRLSSALPMPRPASSAQSVELNFIFGCRLGCLSLAAKRTGAQHRTALASASQVQSERGGHRESQARFAEGGPPPPKRGGAACGSSFLHGPSRWGQRCCWPTHLGGPSVGRRSRRAATASQVQMAEAIPSTRLAFEL